MDALTAKDDFRKLPRFWLIDKFGMPFGWFPSAKEAGEAAAKLWPDQEQDEDRTGKGWDVEVTI